MTSKTFKGAWGLLLLLAAAPLHGQGATEAESAWERGDLAIAERLYTQRLAADSTDGRALHRLALLRAWADRHDESVALFDRLLRHEPRNLDARVDRARVLGWKGEERASVAALDSLLLSDPTFVPALIARAQIASWQGALDDALQTYARALEISPENRDALAGQGRVLSWRSDFEGAAATFESMVRTNPADVDALVGLGNVLLFAERIDSARAVFSRVLTLDAGNAEALTGVARAAAFAGDLVEAETRWRRMVEADPDNTNARVGLATTLRWQGREAGALAVLEEAQRAEPGHADARAQLRQSQLALAPLVRTYLVQENDSDENRITSFNANAGARLSPSLELGAEAYWREAENLVFGGPARAFGGAATIRWQLEPGWDVAGAWGASGSDAEESSVVPMLRASLTSPGRHPVRVALSGSLSALDATAALIRTRVKVSEAALNLSGILDGWRTNGGVSAASFQGGLSGSSNRRLAGSAGAWRRLGTRWTLGVGLRAMGFEEDLGDGYFDPDFYGIAELPVQWLGRRGRWSAEALLAPGVQQVGGEGDAAGTVRGLLSLTHAFVPGRELALVATYASSGVNQLAAIDASDYRYVSFALRGSFTLPYGSAAAEP